MVLLVRNVVGPVFSVLLFSAAGWLLFHELRAYHLHEIIQELHTLPSVMLWAAVGLTFFSYTVMTAYDALALRYVGHPLPYRKIGLASFISYAFSNNIGLSMLAGASVRYRLYSAWGLSGEKIATIVFFCTLSLWLGFFAVGGLILTLVPMTLPAGLIFSALPPRLLGLLLLAPVALYLAAGLIWKRPLPWRNMDAKTPPFGILMAQLLIASADWLLAGYVLFILLPSSPSLSLPTCLAMYMLAQLAGLISQVPGGLGVFETVFLLLVSPLVPTPQVLVSLVAYRAIYYLLPLGFAVLMLAVHEMAAYRTFFRRAFTAYQKWESAIVVPVLSLATFVAGALLLFSGALPALNERLAWLQRFFPLPALEISHFFGSAIGMVLLLLARGIQRRLDGAYWITIILLAAGMVASLIKGLDYEEALILGLLLAALLPSRRYFYRKASLLSQQFTPGWLAAVVTVFICTVWLGLFSHKHQEYIHQLWWQFTFEGNAHRFLRATAGGAGVLLMFAVARLLHPSPRRPTLPGRAELEAVTNIVTASRRSTAQLAFLGDKNFLFNPQRSAFIMFGVEGRSWVSMGDPVGPVAAWPGLILQFQELSDQSEGWTIFYQVGTDTLHHYLDSGLTLTKLGEAARIPLQDFSLEGSPRKGLRYIFRRLEKEGWEFEIIPKTSIDEILPVLKVISDAWLLNKQTREKGFSLGFFNEEYLRRFDIAVIKKDNEVVAFANLWQSGEKEELSIDLMRLHPAKAPNGAMDFLFLHLMFWGKQAGFHWFDLGMAPLAGLEGRAFAPRWHYVAAFIARHGEHFYNFQGLRQYKQKFDPIWQPKYLASPKGVALPHILANLTALIAGGWKGALLKPSNTVKTLSGKDKEKNHHPKNI
jgi:phosphatidylglycerol lysyltransferase